MFSILPLAVLPFALGPPETTAFGDVTPKQDLARLQGTWQYEVLEEDGKKAGPDELKQRSIFFGRDTFVMRNGHTIVHLGAVKLDPSEDPKTFNAALVQGKKKGGLFLGIYAVEGATLKLCYDPRGEDRPEEFKAAPGRILIICKRIQPANELPDLSGEYRSESTEIDGTKHVADAVIERMGDSYLVTYKKNGGIAFIGIGIRKGDIFCMSWVSQGQAGITLYQIEKGHRLVGQYTRLGGPGILSTEVLTRKDFD